MSAVACPAGQLFSSIAAQHFSGPVRTGFPPGWIGGWSNWWVPINYLTGVKKWNISWGFGGLADSIVNVPDLFLAINPNLTIGQMAVMAAQFQQYQIGAGAGTTGASALCQIEMGQGASKSDGDGLWYIRGYAAASFNDDDNPDANWNADTLQTGTSAGNVRWGDGSTSLQGVGPVPSISIEINALEYW